MKYRSRSTFSSFLTSTFKSQFEFSCFSFHLFQPQASGNNTKIQVLQHIRDMKLSLKCCYLVIIKANEIHLETVLESRQLNFLAAKVKGGCHLAAYLENTTELSYEEVEKRANFTNMAA